jgi:hypothetical protein
MDKGRKQAVKITRLSCHRFRANEVRLWPSVIVYNLGNLWRRLALLKLVKGRPLLLAPGEELLTRRPFCGMLRSIVTLPVRAG